MTGQDNDYITEEDDPEAALKFSDSDQAEMKALNNLDQMDNSPSEGDWIDEGIQDVAVDTLPRPEGIYSDADFRKVSREDMEEGLTKFQEMKPVIDTGEGANSDYWAEVDASNGVSYSDGYRRVYDAFYGSDAIRIVDNQGQIDIVNGRHRILLAKEMGIENLPARRIRRR